jgi:hypothetical protein
MFHSTQVYRGETKEKVPEAYDLELPAFVTEIGDSTTPEF